MNRHILPLFLLLSAVMIPSTADAQFAFRSESAFSTGTWVKVTVSKTGIHEISYSQLREMGFENPERVGVFGNGAKVLPMTFTDRYDRPMFSDGLNPVKVIHHGGKLYFYAQGPEQIGFLNSSSGIRCQRTDLNIYSDTGVYFLTDKDETPSSMPTYAADTASLNKYTEAYDYIYHEEDITQNSTDTGQLYWGESFVEGTGEYSWPLSLQYPDISKPATFECILYVSQAPAGANGFVGATEFGITGAEGNLAYNLVPAPSANFRVQSNSLASVTLSTPECSAFIKCKDTDNADFINLDWWMLTYHKQMPSFDNSQYDPQQRLYFATNNSAGGYFEVTTDRPLLAVDVTSPGNELLITESKEGQTYSFPFPTNSSFSRIIVFDTSRIQHIVDDYEPVSRHDLRELALGGADLLIIAPRHLINGANRIANIHRQYDGLEVVVATPQEIYNEFSAGVADPMAVRSIIKMMYESERRSLKNVLFLGPIYKNYREAIRADRPEGHIAFQEPVVNASRESANAMDFYGMTANYVRTTSLQEENMNVGIGVLPVITEQEADRIADKIEEYVRESDFVSFSNEMFFISGPGNEHLHDNQIILTSNNLGNNSPEKPITDHLCIDAYGYNSAKRKFIDNINSGKLFSFYLGHGGPNQISGSREFITMSEMLQLKNRHMGFFYVGGCELSHTDHGERGMGELMVTEAQRGFAGAIIASRTTWSGQNRDFLERISTALFHPRDDNQSFRESTPTIGEIFADAKTSSTYANELCYLLISDPALKVPIPLYKMVVKSDSERFDAGKPHTISGWVCGHDGKPDASFNGELHLKVMYPEQKATSLDYVSGDYAKGKTVEITYADLRMLETTAEVHNGNFSFSVTAPSDVAGYEGEKIQFHTSAYDADRGISAAGYITLQAASQDAVNGEGDTLPPVISADFIQDTRVVDLSLSDNEALSSAVPGVKIDGNPAQAYADVSNPLSASSSALYHIPAYSLSEGRHTLFVTASDMAGNMTTMEYPFTVEKVRCKYNIISSSKTATESMTFILSESNPGSLELVICGLDGAEVSKTSFRGTEVRYDLTDNSGKRLSPGLYRAMVRDNSGFSEWTYFAVIE